MVFDATSSYPSAMWDEKTVYPKVESGFAFKPKPHMNDVHVKAFDKQTFNEDVTESAVLKIKHYNLPDLISQHFPIKRKGKQL